MGERAADNPGLAELLARRDIWRGRQTRPAGGLATNTTSTGWSALDALLDGGWPREGLIELYGGGPVARRGRRPLDRLEATPVSSMHDWFQASLGYGITALLLPWIAAIARTERVALLNPPARPCAERWQREGVTLDHLLMVTPREMRELGWATEEILKSGIYPLVLSWLPPLGFALRRRLKLAAEAGHSCLVTPYPGPVGETASPAGIQLSVGRFGGGLTVRRDKPFHPGEVRLALGGNTTAPSATGECRRPTLTLADRR